MRLGLPLVRDPKVFEPRRVWRTAQDVMAALSVHLLEGSEPDAFLLRDTLAGQIYVTAAQHALMRQMIEDIEHLANIPRERYLHSLGVRVAAREMA